MQDKEKTRNVPQLKAHTRLNPIKSSIPKATTPPSHTSRSKKYGTGLKSFICANWKPKDEPEDMDGVARESKEVLTRENLLALIQEAEKEVRANPLLLEKIWINTESKKKAQKGPIPEPKLRNLAATTPRHRTESGGPLSRAASQEDQDPTNIGSKDFDQGSDLQKGQQPKQRGSQWNVEAMQHLLEDEEKPGELRQEHFQQLADMLQEKISEAEIDELLREADFDGNGSIEVDEFKRVLEYFL